MANASPRFSADLLATAASLLHTAPTATISTSPSLHPFATIQGVLQFVRRHLDNTASSKLAGELRHRTLQSVWQFLSSELRQKSQRGCNIVVLYGASGKWIGLQGRAKSCDAPIVCMHRIDLADLALRDLAAAELCADLCTRCRAFTSHSSSAQSNGRMQRDHVLYLQHCDELIPAVMATHKTTGITPWRRWESVLRYVLRIMHQFKFAGLVLGFTEKPTRWLHHIHRSSSSSSEEHQQSATGLVAADFFTTTAKTTVVSKRLSSAPTRNGGMPSLVNSPANALQKFLAASRVGIYSLASPTEADILYTIDKAREAILVTLDARPRLSAHPHGHILQTLFRGPSITIRVQKALMGRHTFQAVTTEFLFLAQMVLLSSSPCVDATTSATTCNFTCLPRPFEVWTTLTHFRQQHSMLGGGTLLAESDGDEWRFFERLVYLNIVPTTKCPPWAWATWLDHCSQRDILMHGFESSFTSLFLSDDFRQVGNGWHWQTLCNMFDKRVTRGRDNGVPYFASVPFSDRKYTETALLPANPSFRPVVKGNW